MSRKRRGEIWRIPQAPDRDLQRPHRLQGSWTTHAVVATEGDVDSMLNHSLIHAEQRFDTRPSYLWSVPDSAYSRHVKHWFDR